MEHLKKAWSGIISRINAVLNVLVSFAILLMLLVGLFAVGLVEALRHGGDILTLIDRSFRQQAYVVSSPA